MLLSRCKVATGRGARAPTHLAPGLKRSALVRVQAASADAAAGISDAADAAPLSGASPGGEPAGAASSGMQDGDLAARRHWVVEDARDFLATDLVKLFETGQLTTSRYSPSIQFEDPISRWMDLSGYLTNIRLLRTLFKIDFTLHKIEVTGGDQVTARWTMGMKAWPLPWQPNLLFTGRSLYQVDPDTGVVLSHTDYWDALQNNQFLSIEGLVHVVRQVLQVQLTPALETPAYTVLRAAPEYELRRYDPFTVASVAMAPGSGPAGGSGFNELAGYIFGGNEQGVKMEMTTPVFTRSAEAASTSTSMQFVMEERFGEVERLPAPNDPRIRAERLPGGYWAALRFSGWPLDFEVVAAERQLRRAMVRDGLRPRLGYQLARYNEPTVPPFLRRNEVLIELEQGFTWPP